MGEIVDLTQTLQAGIPDWQGCCGFQLDTEIDYADYGFRVQAIKSAAGIGTHMDAPSHVVPGGKSIAELLLETLVAPAVVIDVREKVHADYFISLADIQQFEQHHGEIALGSLVIGFTGWSQYWPEPARYRNVDDAGNRHFPGFSPEAVDYLLTRDIVGIGIDTLSPDGGNATDFPVHFKLLGAGKYIIENLTGLEQLSPVGWQVATLPLKIAGATEAPCRVVGFSN